MEHILLRYMGTIREFRRVLAETRPGHSLPALADEVALYRVRRALREAEERSRRAVDKPPAA